MDYDTTKPVYVYTRTQLFLHDMWIWGQGALFGVALTVTTYILWWPKK
jgi:hypothetical protein